MLGASRVSIPWKPGPDEQDERLKRNAEVARVLGHNVQRYRKKAEISQAQLARRCSLHRTEISLIERGQRTPKADTMLRIAASLGITTGDLVAGLTWHPGGPLAGQYSIEDPEGR